MQEEKIGFTEGLDVSNVDEAPYFGSKSGTFHKPSISLLFLKRAVACSERQIQSLPFPSARDVFWNKTQCSNLCPNGASSASASFKR